jgi:hypothetical protein
MTKRERQGETGMNRNGRQINREAIRRKEDKVRGVELAKGLGIKGEKGLLKLCLDEQQKASARGIACLALGFFGYKPAIPVLAGGPPFHSQNKPRVPHPFAFFAKGWVPRTSTTKIKAAWRRPFLIADG